MSKSDEQKLREQRLAAKLRENLKRRKSQLMRKYFRERHEIIDRSMRELFAARSLYGSH